ncbi:MAG: hypothetical protein IPN34_06060 [Planctomycetes bacterium]|nr:hypothetical protein [Planctomycetota bacterium]
MLRLSAFAFLCAAASGSLSSAQVQSYLIDSNNDQLYSVDLTTGAATFIASTNNNNLGTPAGLAWREDTQELWTIDLAGGEVGTIDVATGNFTPVFQTNLSGWQGFAWDPTTGLYFLANQSNINYSLDSVTGTLTPFAASGASLITCLEVDGAGNLFGIEFSNRFIVQVDKTTGLATRTVQTIGGFQGLGIDPSTGAWYGANTNDDSLHRIDPTTGATTVIGVNGSGVTFAKGFDLVGAEGVRFLGRGCDDAAGVLFRMTTLGAPRLGQSFSIGGVYSTSVPYFLIGGISDQNWLGIQLPLDLGLLGATGCTLYTSQESVLGPLPQSGLLTSTIPNLPGLVGAKSFWQGLHIDGAIARPFPMATSNMAEVTILQ